MGLLLLQVKCLIDATRLNYIKVRERERQGPPVLCNSMNYLNGARVAAPPIRVKMIIQQQQLMTFAAGARPFIFPARDGLNSIISFYPTFCNVKTTSIA